MSDDPVTRTLEDRLEHQLANQLDALRQLARQLVRDPLAADDAVQDTCVAALSRAEPTPLPGRNWLRRVLTNAIRQRQRRDGRRRDRERIAGETLAATSPTLDPAELTEDLEIHRRLLAHVARLPDRHRTIVTLRFWRGCSHAEIATALGITPRLSQERLSLALTRLRTEFDRQPATRGHWRAVLAGWLAHSEPTAPAPAPAPKAATTAAAAGTGWFVMQTKALAIGGLTIAILATLTVWALQEQEIAPPDSTQEATTVPTRSNSPESGPGKPAAETERLAVPADPDTPAPTAPVATVRGAVADIRGRRLPGVTVTFAAAADAGQPGAPTNPNAAAAATGAPHATTAADGSFEMPAPIVDGSFQTQDPEWATVRRHLRKRGPSDDPILIVAAPARDYSGVVLDPANNPVAAARIVIDVPATMRVVAVDGKAVALPHDLAMVESDELGRFTFRAVGWLPGARLTAMRSPFGGGELALPEFSAADLVIRMSPPTRQAAVHGLVLDARSRPVAGALVAAGGGAIRTDATGRFRALWPPHDRPRRVSAVAKGHGSVTAPLSPGDDQPGCHIDNPILLQFSASPRRLVGRVVDTDGRPVAGVRVWTPDLTYLGQVTRSVDGHQIYGESTVEEQFGAHDMLEFGTITTADGTFELAGVLARDYALFAMDRTDLTAVGPVLATPDQPLELVLPQQRREVVAGRVLAEDGTPLADVQVRATRELPWQRPERSPDPWHGCPMRPPRPTGRLTADEVRTDAEGRFELPPCVVEGTRLSCFGDAVFFARPFELGPHLTLDALEIRVPARSTFRILLESMPNAEAFAIRGSNDRIAPVMVNTEGLRMSMPRVTFADGVSPVAAAKAGEFTLVLLRGEAEIHRQRIVLPPGGVHELRL
ncbi:MAG: sigma-70 family RNA polymerase sigma factor [bacterium]|nr:sigma-70 family RNA polymerase sigma factor [bacterium]